jgi:peroxiredoxin
MADVRPRWPLVAAAAVSLAALVATVTPLARAATSPVLGKPAADFALKAVAGDNVRLSEHLGEVVLLNFWATWCGPCRQQMPRLDQLHATYGSAGLVLLGLNVDDDASRATEFVHTVGVTYPVLLDPAKSVAPLYGLDAVPMTVLIDRAGVVRYVHYDFNPAVERQYVAELRELLDE